MNTTQLDTLNTVFGNDLATLLAFLDESRTNGQYVLWHPADSVLPPAKILAALAGTGWQTAPLPKALIPANAVKSYLVVRSSHIANNQSIKAETLCMTRMQWQALSLQHAGDAKYAWLAEMKNANGSEALGDVVSRTGTRATR